MYVLRVETFTGKGCYSTSASFYVHSDASGCICNSEGEHPLPESDEGLIANGWLAVKRGRHPTIREPRFAFSGPLQYLAWFYTQNARERLAESDLLLRVYEAQDEAVIVGTSQSVFAENKARRHMTLRPDIDPGTLTTLWQGLEEKAEIAA